MHDPKATTALSPYLPGTQIQFAWDSTSLGYLKTCPRLYQYTMLDGWSPRGESVHLRFGIEFHKALEEYDRAKVAEAEHEDAIRSTIQALLTRTHGWEVDEDTRAGKYKNRHSIIRLVIDYLDHFADDPAVTFIREDGRPAVELSFRFELDWGPKMQPTYVPATATTPGGPDYSAQQPYLLCGHLDRVVEFSGSLFVMDRKTTTTTPGPYYFAQYDPNNQMTLYTLASQILLRSPIKGVIIDAAQVLVDSSRFVRGFTYRTPDQLEEWVADLRRWLALAEGYATDGYWPMNDQSCGMYGGCRFREVCSKSPQVRETFLKSGFDKLEPDDRWNPLRVRS